MRNILHMYVSIMVIITMDPRTCAAWNIWIYYHHSWYLSAEQAKMKKRMIMMCGVVASKNYSLSIIYYEESEELYTFTNSFQIQHHHHRHYHHYYHTKLPLSCQGDVYIQNGRKENNKCMLTSCGVRACGNRSAPLFVPYRGNSFCYITETNTNTHWLL